MGLRAAARTTFIVVFTAYLVALSGADILLPWHPFATFGFSADRAGVVKSVDASALAAGLHRGDRLDVRNMAPEERLRVGYFSGAPPGTGMQLPLRDGRTVTLTAQPFLRSFIDNASDIVSVFALVAYIVLAGLLVLMRPTPATWAFYGFSAFFCSSGTLAISYMPWGFTFSMWGLLFLEGAIAPVAFAAFALRFPDRAPEGAWKLVERAVLFCVAPLLAALMLGAYVTFIVTGVTGPIALTIVARLLTVVITFWASLSSSGATPRPIIAIEAGCSGS